MERSTAWPSVPTVALLFRIPVTAADAQIITGPRFSYTKLVGDDLDDQGYYDAGLTLGWSFGL